MVSIQCDFLVSSHCNYKARCLYFFLLCLRVLTLVLCMYQIILNAFFKVFLVLIRENCFTNYDYFHPILKYIYYFGNITNGFNWTAGGKRLTEHFRISGTLFVKTCAECMYKAACGAFVYINTFADICHLQWSHH